MDERRLTIRRNHGAVWMVCRCVLVVALVAMSSALRGEEYGDPCDSSKTSWVPAFDRAVVQLNRHERDGYEFHSGTAAEAVRFRSQGATTGGTTYVRLSHPVPRSLTIDELTVTLWLRANAPGAILAVRVTLPHQPDPQTGEPVSFDLHGDTYTNATSWQALTCQTREKLIEDQLQLIRVRLARTLDGESLNTNEMHVAQVVLKVPADRGTTELLLDDLRYGPIVRTSQPAQDVTTVGGTTGGQRPDSPIRIETNRLLVDGHPFFPRILRYHGEPLEALSDAGVNVAGVEHFDDRILMDALADRGIWSMSSPPPAAANADGIVQAAGLMPIPATTSSILFWNVGTRVAPQDLRRMEAWIDQLRDADRAFASPRPVVADVIGDERRFSRYVSLLGSSRHTLHTTVSPLQYRDYLDHRQKLALPDRFKWTWIQTEPADGNVVTRSESRHREVLVEAEQIWLQAWAAISVGHKALGYWTTTPLDAATPAAEERRLALALLNSQIDLLEPWLATGKVVDTVPVSIRLKQSPDLGRRGYGFRNSQTSRGERDALLDERNRQRSLSGRASTEVQAAVIESSYGRLVIPVWYEQGAQFQPGQMAAENVNVLVRSVDDARAWQVTTTGVTPVEMRRVAGGMQVSLPMMDQHAFIVITADPGLEAKLMERMKGMRKRCAQLWVELATAKLDRVSETHRLIEATSAPRVPDASFQLTSASNMLDRARQHLQEDQFAGAQQYSQFTMQLLRQLQRTHWENAAAALTAPTSSPHAVCFNTLPDHWQLVSSIGRNSAGMDENLLRTGDFEDLDAMRVDGWSQIRTAVADQQRKIAELDGDAVYGQHCLRLRSSSAQGTNLPNHIGPDVLVVSPQISVRGGQTLLVSGRVRVDHIAEGEIDGLMIYDSINGTVGAARWQQASADGQWRSFELIREVPAARDVQLTIELHGEGDVRLDGLSMVALGGTLQTGGTAPEKKSGIRRNLLDFAPSLPKVNLWPGRKSAESPTDAAPTAP